MSLARLPRRIPVFRTRICSRRPYSSAPPPTPPPSSRDPNATRSAHARVYTDLLPGMLPVALLGSAVYLALRLTQHNLAHERFLDDARARVRELELEIGELRQRQLLASSAPESGTTGPAETGAKKRGWLW